MIYRRTDAWIEECADEVRDAVAAVGDYLPNYHSTELRAHANVALDLLVAELKRFPQIDEVAA